MGFVTLVEGIPAVGKTTFARELRAVLEEESREDVLLLEEPVPENGGNPFLSLYYENPQRWSFPMQVFLLTKRYDFQRLAIERTLAGLGHAMLDRSYFGDVAFAKVQFDMNFMGQEEYLTYLRLYQRMSSNVPRPDVCVRLDIDPAYAMERLRVRSEARPERRCEQSVTCEYLEQVSEAMVLVYDSLEQLGVRMIRVDWNPPRGTRAERAPYVREIAKQLAAFSPVLEFPSCFSRRANSGLAESF